MSMCWSEPAARPFFSFSGMRIPVIVHTVDSYPAAHLGPVTGTDRSQ
jgi:hypothetical protein